MLFTLRHSGQTIIIAQSLTASYITQNSSELFIPLSATII